MAVNDSVDPAAWLAEQIQAQDPDLLRSMVKTMAEALMSAEADARCGADYGQRSSERTNSRNGYRTRSWDTRAGTVELAIPKLRQGSYFPDWLLERRRRAEQALVSVVATSYLLGVSTRRVDKLVEQLGIGGISKSQVSAMAKTLDEQVEAFRTRALDGGPYTFVWLDALTQKVREGGRTVNVHALVATGVNANGQREILGLEVTSREDGAGWLAFLRGLVARGLGGVQMVISDAHIGLVEASAPPCPAPPGSAAAPTTCAISSPRSPSRPSRGWLPWSGPSLTSRPPSRSAPSTPGSSTPSPPNTPPLPTTSMAPATTCSLSPSFPGKSGSRSGRTTPRSG